MDYIALIDNMLTQLDDDSLIYIYGLLIVLIEH